MNLIDLLEIQQDIDSFLKWAIDTRNITIRAPCPECGPCVSHEVLEFDRKALIRDYIIFVIDGELRK